jgi:hypothetical protein
MKPVMEWRDRTRAGLYRPARLRGAWLTGVVLLGASFLGTPRTDTSWYGAAPLGAQPPARMDTARFTRVTVDSLLLAARLADSLSALATQLPAAHTILQRQFDRLPPDRVGAVRLQQLALEHAEFSAVARRRYRALSLGEFAAVDTIAIVLQQTEARLTAAVGAEQRVAILTPMYAYRYWRREQSMAASVEKLRRFERKYGPGAPTRNAAEVMLNYAAQWVPAFQPNAEGWPSRGEVIASYVPTYVALPTTRESIDAMTLLEAGLRLYIWRDGWGGERGGVLRPSHVSFGLLAAGERDGALQMPWRGTSRLGGFIGWGAAKFGVIGGPTPRVLFTRQVQLVPWVF